MKNRNATKPRNYPLSELQSHNPDHVLEIVLETVLQFLTSRRDLNAASLVCKSWWRTDALTRSELFISNCYAISPRRVVSRFSRILSVTIKGKPRLADFDMLPADWGAHFSQWLTAFSTAYPWLEKVHLKRMSVTDDDLSLLGDSFAAFKELVLVSCEGFGTPGLAAVATKCRLLRVLDLEESLVDINVSDYSGIVDWISCFPEGETHLESLVFDSVFSPINLEALEKLVARSPSLKRLRVNGHVKIFHLYRLMHIAPHLTDLGTGSFDVPEDTEDDELVFESPFAASKSLVCLSGFRDILPEYLPDIYPVCGNLTFLDFQYADIIDTDQIKSVVSRCHKLQTLWVRDAIFDEGLQVVAQTCKDLRELRVYHLHASDGVEAPVSEVGLEAISRGCRKLQYIMFFCQRMTNAAVVALSRNCPNLVVFRLCIIGRYMPDALTQPPMDEGVGAIVMNCKKLTRLDVSGFLTDRAFAYIGKYGKLIRTLSVNFAGDTDLGLKNVLQGCTNLQKLEIRDGPFGDGALCCGLQHFYNMRFLWMSSCKVTRQACQAIAQTLPHLVLEVINTAQDPVDDVELLYMYRSLDKPRDDAPKLVTVLH
ncbi:unnamed protein product [Trifolium pratense]|uniref:Uncharacterized protein n=1 Tax=Trifolium pratense TaxID=57577 RepID=A0ACB0J7V9_TRIPR|nr:unnamed protein product [Trifolium pratense]